MIFTGVLINAVLVIIGTMIGLIFKGERLKNIGQRIFEAFALFVLVMGVSGAMDLSEPLIILGSIIAGVAIGEIIDIDKQFTRLGNWLQNKFAKNDSGFSRGFIEASLLFCVGSMTILGALQSGLEGEHTIYITKGILDMVSAITFAMGTGIGVAFSSISVIVYQGLLTLCASFLSPVLSEEMIALSSTIGSLFLIAIATNMLGITRIKVANFLPAMFMPFVYQAILLIL